MNPTYFYVFLWFVTGVIAAGISFKYFQMEFRKTAHYDYGRDILFSVYVGSIGPFGLVIMIVLPFCIWGYRLHKHGWGFHSQATAKKIQDDARKK